MPQIITSGSTARTTGLFRRELLEKAAEQLPTIGGGRDAIGASLNIKSFINTLDKNGEPYKIITADIEKINKETNAQIQKFEQLQAQREVLQQLDHQNDNIKIYIDDIEMKFQLCWSVAEKFGLFND